jgi:hypothetical protein
MSLGHAPGRKRGSSRALAWHAPLPVYDHDDEVLTFREWCRLNRVSERTGRRMIADGSGPIVTKLSARRIGITRGNNRLWQQSRART